MNGFPSDFNTFPSKWQTLNIQQQPQYKDQSHLTTILNKVRFFSNKIKTLPKIVNYEDIIILKQSLKQVKIDIKKCSENQCFIIQAGDCAERFKDDNEEIVEKKILLLNTVKFMFY
jgi:3-deoxy-7-phosphoheptulonate synthase